MTRRLSLIGVAAFALMALAAPTALARYVEGDSLQSAVPTTSRVSDASDRAKLVPVAPLDVFERAVVANQRDLRAGSPYLDAHQRALGRNRDSELTMKPPRGIGGTGEAIVPKPFVPPTTYSDAFERAAARGVNGAFLAGDNHERIGPATTPVSSPTVSSGREIEWPQIGIGFGVGIVLMLGLYLALKGTRTRPLAH